MYTLSTGNKDSPEKDCICNMMEVKRPEGEEREELVLTVGNGGGQRCFKYGQKRTKHIQPSSFFFLI